MLLASMSLHLSGSRHISIYPPQSVPLIIPGLFIEPFVKFLSRPKAPPFDIGRLGEIEVLVVEKTPERHIADAPKHFSDLL